MSEDELTKILVKKMNICTIAQRKFGCRCAKNERIPFCSIVEELYKELTNDCFNCELYKEAHKAKEWEH
jgi:hypothetical protein